MVITRINIEQITTPKAEEHERRLSDALEDLAVEYKVLCETLLAGANKGDEWALEALEDAEELAWLAEAVRTLEAAGAFTWRLHMVETEATITLAWQRPAPEAPAAIHE